ncbi:LysM peptidoglycan-binding domain-containing protein [Candidatus Saccharibacteria bacterium]|nr:LysM peptidoglycan-binding domain-containing protein [Candidatus Saccharibacteria bacterium]
MYVPVGTGVCISTNTSTISRLFIPRTLHRTKLYRKLFTNSQQKTFRRRVIRTSLLVGNTAVLVAVGFFVLQNPSSGTSSASSILSGSGGVSAAANPLDQLSSADIALTVARMSSLPEATAINNQADSQAIELSMAQSSNNVVSKPQVVTTALKSQADIKSYKSLDGDTVPNLAVKFGVTSDSIRWSNNMTGDSVTAGTKLTIPPVNGIVYTVKDGDTADTLATKFKASKDQIIAYNDAEIKGLRVGDKIIIPNATQVAPALTARAIAASGANGAGKAVSYPWGGSAIYGYNGYDFGYCTWYVASRIAVPTNWGNANTWASLAPLSGWTVSSTPRAGAVGQSNAGAEGHVAYVEAVSDDGTMIKYSDMNGLAGFGRVGNSDWVSASRFPHYIYR